MAKGLETLARVTKWTVDECRRALGILLGELEDLETNRRAIDIELVKEQSAAADKPDEAGLLYGKYAETVINRRDIMDESIRAKEAEIEIALEALNEAYRELKKYEVVRDNRIQREHVEEARREQIELDDIGIEIYRRKDLAR